MSNNFEMLESVKKYILNYMKLETKVDYLTFYICCKLEAEALEQPVFFKIKDLCINNEKSLSRISTSLKKLSTDLGIIESPEFYFNRVYNANPYRNRMIEDTRTPEDLARIGKTLIDDLNAGYFIKVKDKGLLKKEINNALKKFMEDELTTRSDGYLIQERHIISLIKDLYKRHRKKVLSIKQNSILGIDLLFSLKSLENKSKIQCLNYINHRKYFYDNMGHDPANAAIGSLVQASRQGQRYDLDDLEIEFKLSDNWHTEIEKQIFLENFVMELKYFDGRIWIEAGDKKVHIAKMHSFSNNELFKFITSKKPKELIEIKSDNLGDSKPQVDPMKKLLGRRTVSKYLSEIGFDATVRAPFFYDIGKESLKFNGFKITGKRMQEMGIDPEEYLKALEKVQPKEEAAEESNFVSVEAKQ